jgi:hypothetical protein
VLHVNFDATADLVAVPLEMKRVAVVVAPVVAPAPEELDMEIEDAVSRFKAKPLALTTENGCDTSTGMIIHSTPPAPYNASPEY